MIDVKLRTLLAIVKAGNFTKAAEALSLSQPATSYHIRQLEEEYGIKVFLNNKKTLVLTPEGEVLVKYARRLDTISDSARRAIEDCKHQLQHFTVGITQSVGEALIARVLAEYCGGHPHTRISLMTDTIESLYDRLHSYELDFAIVEGSIPLRRSRTELLDMDSLCLVVSPQHRFAQRPSVTLSDLKKERLILRLENAGTRRLFESSLVRHQESIQNFNVILEIDNTGTIKELVQANVGVTVMAHSACREEEASGELVVVPIEAIEMVREVNIVCQEDFKHAEVLDEIRSIYRAMQQPGLKPPAIQ